VLSLRHRRDTPDPSAEPATVFRITNAPVSLVDDQRARVRHYVISMSLRIVFFLLAVVTSGYLRWAFALSAVFIPYFAVVVANGGRERVRQATTLQEDAPAALVEGEPPGGHPDPPRP
jgi:hypothetical protein